MITVTIESRQLNDYLVRLFDRTTDLSQPMSDIGAVLESRIQGRFETQTDPNGIAWHPWAPSTQKSYPRKGTKSPRGPGNAKILDRYGDMLRSLSSSADSTSVTVGFAQRYWVHHEWGTKHMPRRGMLLSVPDAGTLGAEDERLVLDLLQGWLNDA